MLCVCCVLCMCVCVCCVCVCVCVCVRLCVSVCSGVYAYIYMCACVHTDACESICPQLVSIVAGTEIGPLCVDTVLVARILIRGTLINICRRAGNSYHTMYVYLPCDTCTYVRTFMWQGK